MKGIEVTQSNVAMFCQGLQKRIGEYSEEGGYQGCVYFQFASAKEVNGALTVMGMEESCEFIENFVQIMFCRLEKEDYGYGVNFREKNNLALWVFGHEVDKYMTLFDLKEARTLLYTLTSDDKEFRGWYDFPGTIDSVHVDNNGSMLFSVDDRAAASYFKKKILGNEEGIVLKNGTRIFGLDVK